MARPSTTHVLEIESGIGEPAFIPLCLGRELQPLSVGKKGMWRIESARVLDVHAFVYFDGAALFVQSADGENAACVDGYKVGKAWTELHAPCTIEVGNARLAYRSLLDEEPVAAPAGAPPPGASIPAAVAPPPPPRSRPAPTSQRPPTPSPALTFPKVDRPFRPGELSAGRVTDESTRVVPLDVTGGPRSQRRPATGQAPSGPPSAPPPAPSRPPPAMPSPPTIPLGGGVPVGAGLGVLGPSDGAAVGAMTGTTPLMGGGGASVPQGTVAMSASAFAGAPGSFHPGYPAPEGPPSHGAPSGPGAPQPAPGPAPAGQQVLQALKGASVPKVLAGVLFLVGAALFALQETQEKAPRSSNPAPPITGAQAASAATPTPAPVATVAWPAGVACPPPNWPPNTPLPCTPSAPASATVTAPSTATATAVASTAPDKPPRDSGARPSALPPGAKTLERQAVDLVAAGEAAKAAGAYEELIRREPANRVYPEAARILRAKLDAGAPAP